MRQCGPTFSHPKRATGEHWPAATGRCYPSLIRLPRLHLWPAPPLAPSSHLPRLPFDFSCADLEGQLDAQVQVHCIVRLVQLYPNDVQV